MSWLTVSWSMGAGMCLALAGVHLLVWLRDRPAAANLLFGVSAMAAAAMLILEQFLMRAQTPAEYGAILRWMHLPAVTVIVANVWFIRHYLGAGRLWLAWLVTGLRVLVVVLSFLPFTNVTFQEIHALRDVYFIGETFSAPVGETSSWRFLIQLGMVLWLIYVLDAAITAWKRGKKQQASVVGGSILFAIVLAVTFSGLMVRGILPGPFGALAYLVVVLAMAFELSVDLIRAKQLSRELRNSEERMRLAAQAANLGFWDWEISRDQVRVDDPGRRQTGTFEVYSSQDYLSLVHPDDRKNLQRALDETIGQDRDFSAEFRLISPNGGERWTRVLGQVDRGAQGESPRLRGISMDISSRKQLQDELQRHRSALTHAQRVFSMGQLSATLAHELNQPLGAILRNAEAGELFLRQDSPDVNELREIFVDIQRDDQRAAEVINRMRALLRNRELQLDNIALQELIHQVVDLLQSEIQARGAALRITVPPELPRVCGDRVQLQQVLLNLLLNSLDALDALDARQNDLRRIQISAIEVENGQVEVAIEDTGIGIDPDRLPDLFEPFISSKSEGTGLGLAISRTIVEAHGGRIRAENKPGGGACFRFTLPIVREEAPV